MRYLIVYTLLCCSQMNTHLMKKIKKDAEACNILVGEFEPLDRTLAIFIRLDKAVHLGEVTEVPVPTRFMFILLGPRVCTRST